MHFSENEKTTYLFCAPLLQTKTTPLTIIEWNITVKSLAQRNLDPTYLLDCYPSDLLKILTEATEAQKLKIIKKVESRQNLGFGILELEELSHNGYGILFRSDFPKRLKKLNLKQRPPFYYYIGDINILNSQKALSVVGARDANEDELQSVAKITSDAAEQEITVVSGGARGVDSVAVETALQNGGKAIIFPVEGLSAWARKKEYRKYIQNGQVLILSVQPIQARFSGSYAMQRNKFIHSTGDVTLVASSQISGKKKSGTWEGVAENIKEKWSPLYVIGQSEGAEKLKEIKVAQSFTSLERIFIPDNNHVLISLKNHFTDILTKANRLGLSKDEIHLAFQQSYNHVFNYLIVKEENTTVDCEELQLNKNIQDEVVYSTNTVLFDHSEDPSEHQNSGLKEFQKNNNEQITFFDNKKMMNSN